MVADSFAAADEFVARRPALDAPDDVLLEYMLAMPGPFQRVFANHMTTSALSSVVSGILIDACITAGKPGLVTHLMGAAGGVRSAEYSRQLYALATLVRDTAPVAAAFDQGVDGLTARLQDTPEAATFCERFDRFLAEHGHRGPNDWELSGRTWDNTPELALIAIDRMRLAEHDLAPESRLTDDDRLRREAIAEVRPTLNRIDRLNFDKAIEAMPYWSQGREATRDRAVRLDVAGQAGVPRAGPARRRARRSSRSDGGGSALTDDGAGRVT